MHVNTVWIEFKIVAEGLTEDSIIQQPIILNEKPIGVITEAKKDELGLYYHCKAWIWDRFLSVSAIKDSTSENLELDSIVIGD